jgi:hypothetical protein
VRVCEEWTNLISWPLTLPGLRSGRTYDKRGITEAIEETQKKLKDVDNIEGNLQELKEWLFQAM